MMKLINNQKIKYMNLSSKKRDPITSDKVHFIKFSEISDATVVFVKCLNLGGGSIGGRNEIDLYKLHFDYLTNLEKRAKINKILNE